MSDMAYVMWWDDEDEKYLNDKIIINNKNKNQ